MRKLIRLLFSGAIPAPWDIWTWFWLAFPAIAGVLAVIAGYAQSIPWMWIIMAGALTFASVGHALVQWSAWRQKLRVADKLAFRQARIGKKFDDNSVMIGFELENSADFPISCELFKIETRVGNRVPLETRTGQIVEVPAHGWLWFDDSGIDIDPPKPGSLEGSLAFEVRYGRGENRTKTIRMKKGVRLGFDANGHLLGGNWYDA